MLIDFNNEKIQRFSLQNISILFFDIYFLIYFAINITRHALQNDIVVCKIHT